MKHPDLETLCAFSRGEFRSRHIQICDQCQHALAMLEDDSPPEPGPEPTDEEVKALLVKCGLPVV